MVEFIVIVESGADARTATKLAERILVEKVDWLENEKCWEDTSLELLRERGIYTGLTDYIREVEQRLIKIISSNDDNNTHSVTTPES